MKYYLILVIACCWNVDLCHSQRNLHLSVILARANRADRIQPQVPQVDQTPSNRSSSAPNQIFFPGRVTKPICDAGTLCRAYINCSAVYFSTLPVDGICKWKDSEPYVCCPVKNVTRLGSQSTENCAKWKKQERVPIVRRNAPETVSETSSYLLDEDAGGNFTGAGAGGTPVDPGDFPFMASIFESIDSGRIKSFLCGGSLITRKFLMSAAHCFENGDLSARPYLIRMGSLALVQSEDQDVMEFEVTQVIVHPQFRMPSLYHDIALIKFMDPFHNLVFDKYRPICLPDVNQSQDVYTNRKLIMLGWGITILGGPLSPVLQEVEVPVVDRESCNNIYSKLDAFKVKYRQKFDSTIICAGNTEERKDACQGDSGGPLISVDDDFLPTLVGVVSSGFGCGTVGVPGIYTRVDRYLPWIAENIT